MFDMLCVQVDFLVSVKRSVSVLCDVGEREWFVPSWIFSSLVSIRLCWVLFGIVCCICYYSNLVAIFYIGFRLWVCLWHFKSVGAIFSVNLAVYISKMRYYVHYLHFSDYCPHLCRHVYHNVSAIVSSGLLQVVGMSNLTLYFAYRSRLF